MKKITGIFLVLVIFTSVFTVFSPLTASAATSGYYTYEVLGEEATITKANINFWGSLTIPSTLGGYPVTSISGSAF